MDEIQTWWQGHFPSAFISTPCLFLQLGHQDERPHYSRQPSHTPVIISQIAQSQRVVLPLIKKSNDISCSIFEQQTFWVLKYVK